MRALQPEDVVAAPELLVLASLEPALHALPVALVAAYPELLNELGRERDPPPLAGARRLLRKPSASYVCSGYCSGKSRVLAARLRRAPAHARRPGCQVIVARRPDSRKQSCLLSGR